LNEKLLRLATAACVSVALAVAPAACGGSGSSDTGAGAATTAASDEAAIRSVISQYQDAVRTKDDAAFCSLVTAEYEQRLAGASGPCTLPPYSPQLAALIGRAKVADVAVSGPAATAKLAPGGSIRLEKVGDTWEISDLDGLAP
jgi:hypothetical protein